MDYKLRDYFAFNKRERVGVMILLPVIVLIISFPWLLPRRPPPAINYSRLQQTQQQLEQLKGAGNSKYSSPSGDINVKKGSHYDQTADEQSIGSLKEDSSHAGPVGKVSEDDNRWRNNFGKDIVDIGAIHSTPVLFLFDPNTLPEKEWKKLGVPERVARTVQRYLAKGGRFRKPTDLGKIYGMPEDVLKRLLPYVNISINNRENHKQSFSSPANTFSANDLLALPPHGKAAPRNEQPAFRSEQAAFTRAAPPAYHKRAILPIDINNSDTSAWIALPGIGSKLANRIIRYRESLGGFHSIDQVAEIYGLRDSVFQELRTYLQCAAPSLRKININTEETEELKQHPYIRWQLAALIVQYRKQHGAYKASEELAHLALMTPELLKKLLPYVETVDPSRK